ncbi:phosphotransferase-like protein [Kineosporia babensis]
MAAKQAEAVHQGIASDLEVSTGKKTWAEVAARIRSCSFG